MATVKYLEKWAESLLAAPSLSHSKVVRVDGVRDAHLGPRMEVARVSFLIEPAAVFEVVTADGVDLSPENERFLTSAIFGLLDVIMLADYCPIRDIKVTVVALVPDPVSSSQMAFRHAGRDAGRRFMEARHQNEKAT